MNCGTTSTLLYCTMEWEMLALQLLWIEYECLYKVPGFMLRTKINLQIPVFYRGGSIVARKDTPRRNTVEQRNDTYTVYIFADRVILRVKFICSCNTTGLL